VEGKVTSTEEAGAAASARPNARGALGEVSLSAKPKNWRSGVVSEPAVVELPLVEGNEHEDDGEIDDTSCGDSQQAVVFDAVGPVTLGLRLLIVSDGGASSFALSGFERRCDSGVS
jgi:hypothetical protein